MVIKNLGDSIMGRALAADRNQGLSERLDRLRDERKALNETRSVAELDAALAAARGAAGRTWGRTDECRRPDRGDMVACKRTIELREAHARAERRDRLDREIDDLEARAAETPVISADDPGAVTIAEILPWVTRGLIHPSERDVQRLRILLFSLLPTFSGLLLGIGASMRRGQRWRR